MNIGKWEASVFEFSGLSTSAICNFVLPRCVFIVADIAAYLGIGLDRLGQQRGGQVLFGKGWNPGRRLAPGRDRRLCLRTTLFCLDGVGHGKRAVRGKSGPPRGIWEPEGLDQDNYWKGQNVLCSHLHLGSCSLPGPIAETRPPAGSRAPRCRDPWHRIAW